MRTAIKSVFLQLLPGVAILIIWQLYVNANSKSEFFLGSPIGIFNEFTQLITTGNLLFHFGITISEALSGFIIGSMFGTIMGLCLWLSKTVYNMAKPYVIILGSLPVFALGPILIFWFGTGMLSKVVIVFLTTFVIALMQAYNGATQTDNNLLVLMKAFGASKMDTLRKIIIPSSLIWVLSGIKINIGMALLGAFVGEFISSKAGLGHIIIVAEGLFNVNQIWVGIFGLVTIALIFNSISTPIENWAKKWNSH